MPWLDLNLWQRNEQEAIETEIEDSAKTAMNLKQIIMNEISEWESSKELKWMDIGERYYQNEPDILKRKRMAVGESGALEPVQNLANNKLIHAFTRKLVDQKVGYLISKPMSVRTDNETYQKQLDPYFDRDFLRKLRRVGTSAINKGIAWLHPYYNNDGTLNFMQIPSQQCIPIWTDASHTELQAMIRFYVVETYEGKNKKDVYKVEWWDTDGVRRYEQDGGSLIPDVQFGELTPHVVSMDDEGNQQGYNWERIPFIPFKYNDDEIPLIKFIKSLVDDYDKQKSDDANNLEDLPNSLYIVKNYGDTKADAFRKNIAQYRVVFVNGDGGVDTKSIPIQTEAVKTHLEQGRKDIYEFGRGVDTQTDKFGTQPSGVALRQLYADLDLDCNVMENEFQASLEQLMWFINTDLANKGQGDYFDEKVDFVFNRDMMVNESEMIENYLRSGGQPLSEESTLAHHPWVQKVQDEKERMREERQERMNEMPTYQFPGEEDQNRDDEE